MVADKPCPRCTNATTPLANVNRFHLCDLHLRTIAREIGRRVAPKPDDVSELKAEIARLQDLVAKFQRGGVSTLFAEENVDG